MNKYAEHIKSMEAWLKGTLAEARSEGVLVSHDAQIDSGVAMFLNSGQQSGAIAVPDLSRMEVIFWVQKLSPGEKTC